MFTTPIDGFVPSSQPGSSYQVFPKALEKPGTDENEYRLLRLQNGLQALLISDKTADKAGAAMDIGVGHLDDPDDVPGCAHFCEHLSFMGTKQFPKENEYQEFIQAHGGHTNAFTAASSTNYYFNVSASHLLPALERFSTFFHSPLFSPGATTKEIQAVDSENKKNLNSDGWRLFQLGKSLSAPGHVWTKFGSGNAQTLRADVNEGQETREKLIKWWERSYAAPRMGLVVLGKDSLDELEKHVVEYFSPIPNRGLEELPHVTEPALGAEQLGRIVHAKSVMEFRSIEITWPIPWQSPGFLVKPTSFLAHFLGHEGPGSVFAYLKKLGWALGLSAGKSSGGRGFDFFKVSVSLTEEGYKNYQAVAIAIYKYISLLRASPLPAWYQDEIISLSHTAFRFLEKQRPDQIVSHLAGELLKPYPREMVMSTSTLTREWDEQAVRDLLEGLTVRGSAVMVVARDVEEGKLGEKEKWYGTEYGIEKMSEEFIKQAESPNDIADIHLPGPNAFIPENLKIDLTKPAAQPIKRPTLIRDSPISCVWHKTDDQFLVPKAAVYIEIRSPICNITPRAGVKTRLFGELVRDALNEYSYDASLAGLDFNAGGHADGFGVTLEGYNDKLPVLLRTVLEKVKSMEFEKERFEVVREQLKQDYENFAMDQPYEQSDWYGSYLLLNQLWTYKDRLAELADVTFEEVQNHARELITRMHMNMLIIGNISRDAAEYMCEMTEDILKARPITAAERMGDRAYLLPPASNYVWQDKVPNAQDPNSGLTYYIQVGDVLDRRLRAVFSLFAHIVHEPCFNELRTKEQLGYIVSSGQWMWPGVMGFHVLVQSERDPVYVESRVEAFFDYVKTMLEEMDDAEFEKQKNGLIDKRLEKTKNLTEEAHRFWAHIHNGYHEFTRREIDAKNLRPLTKQDVIDFFLEHIHPSSQTRAKLSVHLRSQVQPGSVPKFSLEAAKELLPELMSRNVPVQEDQYFALSGAQPPVQTVKDFFKDFLANLPGFEPTAAEEIQAAIDRIMAAHPVEVKEEETVAELPPGAVLITDVAAFQSGLLRSKAPVPVPPEEDDRPMNGVNGAASTNGVASKL